MTSSESAGQAASTPGADDAAVPPAVPGVEAPVELVDLAFRMAVGGRLPADKLDDLVKDLNLARFVTDDGAVDTDRVLAAVERLAPVVAAPLPRGPVIPGHLPPSTPVVTGEGERQLHKRFGPGGVHRELFDTLGGRQ